VTWDPQLYLRFAEDRARPFADLLARVDAARVDLPAPERVVDLGCGPGTATATLLPRWPDATVHGIDNSPSMIESAGQLAGARLTFTLGAIEDWQPAEPVDVIVSNAALQWVSGHQALLPRWVAALRPGGVLAFQVPAMSGSAAGRVFAEVAGRQPWRDQLAGVAGPTVGSVMGGAVRATGEYLRLLAGEGCRVDGWETTYLHVLPGADPVLEWFAGTGLRPYLDALEPRWHKDFRSQVAEGLREAYPPDPFGTVLPFHRRFVVARRP
jgi:trans-aconitate 2-methyltransferase